MKQNTKIFDLIEYITVSTCEGGILGFDLRGNFKMLKKSRVNHKLSRGKFYKHKRYIQVFRLIPTILTYHIVWTCLISSYKIII